MASRRDFLKTVILSSGAVFTGLPLGCHDEKRNMFSSVKQINNGNPPINQRALLFEKAHKYLRENYIQSANASKSLATDVAIVGCGPSGLTAAMYLMNSGYNVTLIDSEDSPGGAAISGTYKDIRFPLASIYFVDNNQTIQDLCRFANVTPIQTPSDGLLYQGVKYIDYWKDNVISTLPISKLEIENLKRFRDDILSFGELPPYPLPEKLSGKFAQLAEMTVQQYCQKYNSTFLNKMVDLYTRSSMGGGFGETNAYCFLNFYASEIGMDAPPPRYTFTGGLNGLTKPVADNLTNAKFLVGNLCLNIENTAKGVTLKTIDSKETITQIDAKYVIVACQKFMVPTMINSLPEPQKNAIKKIKYSPYLTVHLCADRNILGKTTFDTWLLDSGNICTDIIDPQSIGQQSKEGAFVASVYSPRPYTERAILQSNEVIASLSRKIADEVTSQFGVDTKNAVKEIQTFAWGHSLVTASTQTHNGVAQTASRKFENIHFANTDNDCSPAFENAVLNGQKAAEDIIKRLKS